jgi:hypothetical protein
MQRRLEDANRLGWRQGYFEGWIAHAKGVPLHVVPPTLFEVEEVLRQRHGWREWPRDSLFDYLRIAELSDGVAPDCPKWKEWETRKIKELNDKYAMGKHASLGSNEGFRNPYPIQKLGVRSERDTTAVDLPNEIIAGRVASALSSGVRKDEIIIDLKDAGVHPALASRIVREMGHVRDNLRHQKPGITVGEDELLREWHLAYPEPFGLAEESP